MLGLVIFVILILIMSAFFEKQFIAFISMLIGGLFGWLIGTFLAPLIFQNYGDNTKSLFSFLLAMTISFTTAQVLRYELGKRRRRGR